MVLIHVLKLENIFFQIKVVAQKQHKIAHEMFVVENSLFQHFEDDFVGREVDFRRLHREFFDNVKGKRMESADLCGNLEALVDTLLQFADCFSGIGNDDNLFRMNSLFLHQIFHLGCHCGSLTCTSASDQQAVIIVCNDCAPLFFVQLNSWVNIFEDVIKVFLLLMQYAIHIICVMRGYITIQGMHLG